MTLDDFKVAPCRSCKEREIGCHDYCSRFFAYKVAKSRTEKRKREHRDAELAHGVKTMRAIKEKKRHR